VRPHLGDRVWGSRGVGWAILRWLSDPARTGRLRVARKSGAAVAQARGVTALSFLVSADDVPRFLDSDSFFGGLVDLGKYGGGRDVCFRSVLGGVFRPFIFFARCFLGCLFAGLMVIM